MFSLPDFHGNEKYGGILTDRNFEHVILFLCRTTTTVWHNSWKLITAVSKVNKKHCQLDTGME